jgi:hypothetical protein
MNKKIAKEDQIEQVQTQEYASFMGLYWRTPFGFFPFLIALKLLTGTNKTLGIALWTVSMFALVLARFFDTKSSKFPSEKESKEGWIKFKKYVAQVFLFGTSIGLLASIVALLLK